MYKKRVRIAVLLVISVVLLCVQPLFAYAYHNSDLRVYRSMASIWGFEQNPLFVDSVLDAYMDEDPEAQQLGFDENYLNGDILDLSAYYNNESEFHDGYVRTGLQANINDWFMHEYAEIVENDGIQGDWVVDNLGTYAILHMNDSYVFDNTYVLESSSGVAPGVGVAFVDYGVSPFRIVGQRESFYSGTNVHPIGFSRGFSVNSNPYYDGYAHNGRSLIMDFDGKTIPSIEMIGIYLQNSTLSPFRFYLSMQNRDGNFFPFPFFFYFDSSTGDIVPYPESGAIWNGVYGLEDAFLDYSSYLDYVNSVPLSNYYDEGVGANTFQQVPVSDRINNPMGYSKSVCNYLNVGDYLRDGVRAVPLLSLPRQANLSGPGSYTLYYSTDDLTDVQPFVTRSSNSVSVPFVLEPYEQGTPRWITGSVQYTASFMTSWNSQRLVPVAPNFQADENGNITWCGSYNINGSGGVVLVDIGDNGVLELTDKIATGDGIWDISDDTLGDYNDSGGFSDREGLQKYFPFSLPWDLVDLVSIVSSEPETPVFEASFPALGNSYPFTIDLSRFDEFAVVFRWFVRILFIAGLIWSGLALLGLRKSED